MQSNGYTGDGIQGEITGKADVDTAELDSRGYDANDAMFTGKRYPHGGNHDNLKVIRGELLFYKKGQNDGIRPLVFSSFNGMYIHDASNEKVLEKRLEFYGIAKGDYEYGGDNFDGQAPIMSIIGVVIAGSVQVKNLTNGDIIVGDLLEWTIPRFDIGPSLTEFNSPKDPYAKNGTNSAAGKLLGTFRRANFYDYTAEVEMAQIMNRVPAGGDEPGISDLGVNDVLKEDKRDRLTPDQEQALGLKYGALALMAMGARLAQANPDLTPEDILADAQGDYFKRVRDNPDAETPAEQNVVSLLMGAVNGALMQKKRKCVARAGSSAGPGEDYVAILRS